MVSLRPLICRVKNAPRHMVKGAAGRMTVPQCRHGADQVPAVSFLASQILTADHGWKLQLDLEA